MILTVELQESGLTQQYRQARTLRRMPSFLDIHLSYSGQLLPPGRHVAIPADSHGDKSSSTINWIHFGGTPRLWPLLFVGNPFESRSVRCTRLWPKLDYVANDIHERVSNESSTTDLGQIYLCFHLQRGTYEPLSPQARTCRTLA